MRIYGVMAQFESLDALIEAVEKVRVEGYVAFDAYTPFPSHDLDHAMGIERSKLPWIVLGGGLTGAVFGYGMQYYLSAIQYPLNVGGRPLHSWPYFVPVTFECIILFASLATVFGMLGLNRLPTPYHSVFNDPQFALASAEAFFLCVEARDPKFDSRELVGLFESLEAQHVAVVPD